MSEAKALARPVPPGGTIGILGGGQLGRMLALAASQLGLKACIYSDELDAPAFQVTPLQLAANYDDRNMLTGFAQICDVITFEFENLSAESIAYLSSLKPVCPGARALEITQDRFTEKSFVASLGLKTPEFYAVPSLKEAEAAFLRLARPGVLKTRRLGYDGRGQTKVSSPAEAAAAFCSAPMQNMPMKGIPMQGTPCILEGFVDFAFEASVIAARGADGTFAAYDPPENIHENHILRCSTVPSGLNAKQVEEAKTIAKTIADALSYVGVFAVELFVAKDGTLLVNEIAPRVHNSGHWTIEACACSQFEQHIRAVAGWPLGSPARHADAVMENIIGAEADTWESLARDGSLHLYGKRDARTGRKMGHVTRLSPLTAR